MPYELQIASHFFFLLHLGPEIEEDVGLGNLVGRAGDRFVVYVYLSSRYLGDDHPLMGLDREGRDLKGLVTAKPMVVVKGERFTLEFILERPYDGFFKPLCIPPLGRSRWWVYNVHAITRFYDKEHEIYVLEDTRIRIYNGEDGMVTPYELLQSGSRRAVRLDT